MEKLINPDKDNRFKNSISSLFQKDIIRMCFFKFRIGGNKLKVKAVTVVEGDPKPPFSTAAATKWRGGMLLHPRDCFT